MRFSVNRMGEPYKDVTERWLASIVTAGEYKRILKMNVGDKLSFERGITGPVGATKPLEIERTS